jgi:ribonuclease T1
MRCWQTLMARWSRRLLLAFGLTLLVSFSAQARSHVHGLASIAWADLPVQAQQTLALIRAGGPFPYPRKDGSVFSNREGALPRQARGYYHEYTVPTPGSRDRGARRIIAGSGPGRDVRTSGEYYYTDDHYASFRRIDGIPAP